MRTSVLIRRCVTALIGAVLVMPSAPAAAVAAPASLGYLGGSLTVNAVDGYFAVGGQRFWLGNDSAYGGGTVTVWAQGINDPSNPYWVAFANLRDTNPPTVAVWVQLLAHQASTANPPAARQVVQHVKQLVPGARVYVSAMNGYTSYTNVTCTTPQAVAQMRAIAARLVTEGLALEGPQVGNLDPATQTRDNCHANDAGKQVLGTILHDFFG